MTRGAPTVIVFEEHGVLQRDAAMLTDLLKQAHYQAEVTVGQARPTDAGGFSGGSPSQGQSAFADGGARPGQGGGRQADDGQRQPEQRPGGAGREGARRDETVRSRDGSVYL